jgi:predicted transcriptional regulator
MDSNNGIREKTGSTYSMTHIFSMVERVAWMSPIDYSILEFFGDHDIVVSPKILSKNIDYEKQYIGKRCRVLVQHGLLQQPDRGLYELTEKGRAYLAGDLDTDNLEE